MAGWLGGGEELELRLSSGQLELGPGLSLAICDQLTAKFSLLCCILKQCPKIYRSDLMFSLKSDKMTDL